MEITKRLEGLARCPFCGGDDVKIETEEFYDSVRLSHPESGQPLLAIECDGCHTVLREYGTADYATKAKALVKRWNTRVLVFNMSMTKTDD